jgi:putative two-component system response regulator
MDRAEDGATPPKILIVDDLSENIEVLATYLRPKGYTIIAATNGEEALAKMEGDPPDVILLDLAMPGMDGYEVCRRLKKSPMTWHIPIIVVTGLTELSASVTALEAGADDILIKPYDPVLLGARIRNSLRAKFMQDQIIRYHQQLEEYNKRLESHIQDRTNQLSVTQQVTVFSLAKLSESRDTETGTHLERIRAYTREIALELAAWGRHPEATTEGFAEQLYQSSPLHDIGKVGIPDRILLKPAKLSGTEWEIMKTHTVIGGDTLKAADLEAGRDSFLAMGRDIAYFHHERWDGQGYPTGLAGEQIPLAARIVAVSDVYDALTSRRPYKEPLSHEVSKKIIVDGRGTLFDPDIVDAFLSREERFMAIHAGHDDLGAIPAVFQLNDMLDQFEKKSEPVS